MAINVVDSIMGSGKTEAVIRFLNQHPEERVLYITPYLSEIARIRDPISGCGPMRILEPEIKYDKNFKKANKYNDVIRMMQSGLSIATTHALFLGHPQAVLDLVRDQGYTLIIDQALQVLMKNTFLTESVKVLIDAGRLVLGDDGYYRRAPDAHAGDLEFILDFADSHCLYDVKGSRKNETIFYWSSMCQAIANAKDVLILTYMFECQDLYYFFKMNQIEYGYMGIRKIGQDSDSGRGMYELSSLADSTTPEYVYHLDDLIVIPEERQGSFRLYDFDKGGKTREFSKSWMNNSDNEQEILRVRKNGFSFFTYMYGNTPVSKRMWGTYVGSTDMDVPTVSSVLADTKRREKIRGPAKKLTGDGVHTQKTFLTFNRRASNEWSDRKYLAYYCNIFAPPQKKIFVAERGSDLTYSDDKYALSTMIQWIFRSALRNGEQIYIYVPSNRMRSMLDDWKKHPYIAKDNNVLCAGGSAL